MMQVIVTKAVLPPSALAELKDWLGITTTVDDTGLSALLATALDVCADFIGMMPLACTAEENIPLPTDRRPIPGPMEWQTRCYPADWRLPMRRPGFYTLDTRPVTGVVSVQGLLPDGTRTNMTSDEYELRLDADGSCAIRVNNPVELNRGVVRFTAGMASDWTTLPEPLRHGVMRLAAYQYRNRDTGLAEALPPATVSALWRPWRRLRLA
jgi:hypothetical protein